MAIDIKILRGHNLKKKQKQYAYFNIKQFNCRHHTVDLFNNSVSYVVNEASVDIFITELNACLADKLKKILY